MGEAVLNRKKAQVEEIKQHIANAQSMVLVDYRGLNVAELTELRGNYRDAGIEYKVYKNTMLRFAFEDSDLGEFNEHLVGPSAIAFGFEDPVSVAKITNDFAKQHDKLEIKAGIIDGKVIGVEGVQNLANLPSREELLGQLVRGLNSPIQGFANVLTGNLRGLVTVLSAIKEEKENA